ncbi:MAG: YIP1 family protein [Deltaproteobacteria bacterium]|nr:YIP1 family protein [Deltaproteobacteria bacterium]
MAGAPVAAGAMATAAMGQFKLSKMLPRVIKMFTDPRGFWQEVAGEQGGVGAVMPAVIVFVTVSSLAGFIGTILSTLMNPLLRMIFGRMMIGAVVTLVIGVALGVGFWFLLAILIKAFAKTFGGSDSMEGATKIAFGALMPMWVASVFSIIPFRVIGLLASLGGFGYGVYLMWLGLQEVNATPKDKAVGYTAATMAIYIVSAGVGMAILGIIGGCFLGAAVLAG